MIVRPDPSGIRRVLVIRRRGLGDALLSVAACEALADAYPRSEVDLLIDRPFVPLLERVYGSGQVLSWPPATGSSLPAWVRSLRARGYDLVVDQLSTPRTALWTALSGARWRVGFDLKWRSWAYNVKVPRKLQGSSVVEQYTGESAHDLIRALGIEPSPWAPPVFEPQHSAGLDDEYLGWREAVGLDPRRDLALIVSAGWPTKAWPVAHVAALAEIARQGGRRIILVPGPADDAMTREILALAPDLCVAPPTSLAELADLMSRCGAYIGTDGGAQHVATVVGVPKVTLFGPTDALSWNRNHPDHVGISTDEPCSPCSHHECPVPGHPCMTNITPERVWNGILRATGTDEECR